MSTTTQARTARVPHLCYICHWKPGLRGMPTILPGHRYLRQAMFPDGIINQAHHPVVLLECVACVIERDDTAGLLEAGACTTFCCGEMPCARPLRHNGDHSCRDCPA